MNTSAPRRIVVGVAGGIAAYKACHLVRSLTEGGDSVRVVPTPASLRFVGEATWEALSGQPVSTTVFEAVDEVQHVHIGQQADAIVIAPATADLLARLAAGRADDLLSATVLVATCPIILAPAMHTEMWQNPATQANVATLRQRGLIVLEPAHGRLTGRDSGPGRLPEPEQIAELTRSVLAGVSLRRDWEGRSLLVTAGGTQENLDPVRFLGNRSSGRQGWALAEIAVQRGAAVTLVAADTEDLPVPPGAELIRARSAREMHEAVSSRAASQDAIIMAAAVADLRPARVAEAKMKKGRDDDALSTIELVENPDILRGLVEMREAGRLRPGVRIAGFAAETGDSSHSAVELAELKLRRKGCDVLMCNEVGVDKVFGQPTNGGVALIRRPEGECPERRTIAQGSKQVVAAELLDIIAEQFRCQM
ncbi:bifunctional phosphopantothenoylcysteine decarboxylase/phosphopantothenate--cysteine ligase CoaBC [Corynebacterium uropygiale]|uniref:Coenzyme A biosynthesis bifunctional protein CoaBC n=1 Tax=Corynebacterium uropygiale TaxID=1775911 RepID=A0A9X1QT59_9CORY|nr:bifunctional phosphopantothenoylcysteine decarboxylase/phosphopantothenate--cysteine ligase CoaBC [Corynebacterium uropygiale]MCF4006570.1 bifunctional phosphopantothenoylcysteine decarboxylase/phosphopantothenate--cysteine ligase CoaBC [Corynebacterium uropygiale]